MDRKLSARELVLELSLEKALAVAPRHPNAIIIAADTVASLGRYIRSKPETKKEAREMLGKLSGKTHQVWTGYCVIDTGSGKRARAAVRTLVRMRALTEKEIEWYVDTGEAVGGAGGYKMQGRGHALIASINGDYNNIIGLPLASLLKTLKRFGVVS